MSDPRSRLLLLTVAYAALVLGSTLVMSWFEMSTTEGSLGFGLRTFEMCASGGACASITFSDEEGAYFSLGPLVFWGSLAVALVVVVSAARRLSSGTPQGALERPATLVSLGLLALSLVAGYVVGPNGSEALRMFGIDLERTWAPLMLIVAHALGPVVLHLAGAVDFDAPGLPAFPPPVSSPDPAAQPRDVAAIDLTGAGSAPPGRADGRSWTSEPPRVRHVEPIDLPPDDGVTGRPPR